MYITQPKVFISSTVKDMPSERQAAYNAVLKAGAFPVMCEFTMTAQNADSVTNCLNMVKESDIYVLILGGKYGWQPDEKESITELEYKTAIERKLPVLIFNTTYPKDNLQKQFETRVNRTFWKEVSDAFELEIEIEKSLKEEIAKKQEEYFNKKEPIYSNLVKINFPRDIYLAKLNIDKEEIKSYNKKRGFYKRNTSLKSYAVSALYMKGISFSHDWVMHGKQILTFHDLQDPTIPLTQIIDMGTVNRLSPDEFYSQSQDTMSDFKFLLKKCLETELHKLNIKWIKEERLFAFVPIKKDDNEHWLSREISWQKANRKATRTVVDVKRDYKNKDKVYNLKCLAFHSKFEYFDNEWFLMIKPDWIFLWKDLTVCPYAFENIQWLKKNERNMHVFNHFNFILKYLQPAEASLFPEYGNYRFLTIGQIEKFNFAPVIPDDVWANIEVNEAKEKLMDKEKNWTI